LINIIFLNKSRTFLRSKPIFKLTAWRYKEEVRAYETQLSPLE